MWLMLCVLGVAWAGSACDDDITVLTSSTERRYVAPQLDGTMADTQAPDDTSTPDTAAPETLVPDTTPADTTPTDTTPTDTTPTDTTPADTTPTDTTPADTTPADTTPADTTPADTTPADTTPAPLHAARYPTGRVHSPMTPSIVQRLQEIRAVDPALADDVFMKVGASTTVSNAYLKCFATSAVDLGAYPSLQTALDYFLSGNAAGSDPFTRATLAAKVGVSAIWAITGDPAPLEQEYLSLDPRFAFVNYGTNDMGLGTTHESALWNFGENLWTLVDELLSWGVIPIVVNIARRLDSTTADAWVPTYNAVIRGLAQGRQVPFIDINMAYEPLPNHGMANDGIHGTTSPNGSCRFTADGLQYALTVRNLHSLTALDRVSVAMLDGEALDPAGPALIGSGTLADPIVIDGLPFSDMRSTADSTSRQFNTYSGCDSTTNEAGPERIYRFDVTTAKRIRATVHDRDDGDIDLHLLDASASVSGCLARAHRIIEYDLTPGTYYFVLDTFVSGGAEQSGEYLLTILERP